MEIFHWGNNGQPCVLICTRVNGIGMKKGNERGKINNKLRYAELLNDPLVNIPHTDKHTHTLNKENKQKNTFD